MSTMYLIFAIVLAGDALLSLFDEPDVIDYLQVTNALLFLVLSRLEDNQ